MSYSISPDGNRIGIVATDPEPASRARDRRDKRDVIWVEHTETVHRLYLVNTKTWRSREVPTLTDMDSLAWSEQDFDDHIMAVNYTSQGDTFKPGIPLTKKLRRVTRGQACRNVPPSHAEQSPGSVHVTFLLNFFDEVDGGCRRTSDISCDPDGNLQYRLY